MRNNKFTNGFENGNKVVVTHWKGRSMEVTVLMEGSNCYIESRQKICEETI